MSSPDRLIRVGRECLIDDSIASVCKYFLSRSFGFHCLRPELTCCLESAHENRQSFLLLQLFTRPYVCRANNCSRRKLCRFSWALSRQQVSSGRRQWKPK